MEANGNCLIFFQYGARQETRARRWKRLKIKRLKNLPINKKFSIAFWNELK
jgi:hypothetical protein